MRIECSERNVVSAVHVYHNGYDSVRRTDQYYAGFLWQVLNCTCVRRHFLYLMRNTEKPTELLLLILYS